MMNEILNEKFVAKTGISSIYRLDGGQHTSRNGRSVLNPIRAVKYDGNGLPSINRNFLVPVELTNHVGKKYPVLGYCNPFYQLVYKPFFIIDEFGKLVNAEESGFVDPELGYYWTHDIHFMDIDEKLQFATKHLPDDIPVFDFHPKQDEIVANIGYIYVDPYFFEPPSLEEILQSSLEGEDDKVIRSYELIKNTRLHRVQITKIPQDGNNWNLPIEIMVNQEQTLKGFIRSGRIFLNNNPIIFTDKHRLVSLDDKEKLLDCGIVVDENVFGYRYLLSEADDLNTFHNQS